MKSLILTNSFPAYKGDIQSPFVYRLAENLAKQKIDITVVCPYYKKSKAKKESFDGIKTRRFQYMFRPIQTLTEGGGVSSFMRSPWGFIQGCLFLTSMFFKGLKESKNADIIHCQWAFSAMPGYIISRIRGIPYIITLRGEDITLAKKWIFKVVQKFLLRRASYINSNNKPLVDMVKRNYKISTPTVIIENGVDINKFKPRSKKEARKKLSLPENKKIILFTGWLIERKGIRYLLEGYSRVVKKHPESILLIIGEGPLKEKLQQTTKYLKLENQVVFLGRKHPDEMPHYISACDIFILPSLAEGMPNVVMEAMASGKAVIATNVQGTLDLLDNYGVLINPKSSNEIASSLDKLLKNPRLIEKLGKESRKSIIQRKLTWQESAKKYKKVYQEVLAS